ncbi:hypothetical protein Y032_0498g2516 [Ancylostoma ceylanicum]|uniref:GOLD domain-containing protein n=1 Tax=Ancylostoma ceylanicum TaxID=53326 RepID=A0A016WUI0_9BILA|nr:hypothetical protein Y032_0498g2516 [Ancylostoma ceylanicum]
METLIAFLLCFGIATAIDCPSMSNLVKVDIDFPRFVALVNVTKIEDWKSYKGDEYVTFHFHYRGFYKVCVLYSDENVKSAMLFINLSLDQLMCP